MAFDATSTRTPPVTRQARLILASIAVALAFPIALATEDLTPAPILVLFGSLSLLLGLVMLPAWWRRRSLRLLASELGLTYSKRDEEGLPRRLRYLDIFDEGHTPRLDHVLSGPMPAVEGFEVRAFDLERRNINNQHALEQGVLLVFGGWHTPRVVITAEPTFERLGLEPIDLELNEFNERWRVLTDDRKFAHALLHPRAIEALMEHLPRVDAGVSIELHRGVLQIRRVDEHAMVSQTGELWHPAEIRLAVGLAEALLVLVPSFLRTDHAELRCATCGEAQPSPTADCLSCGAELCDPDRETIGALDRLSALEVVGYGAMLFALPLANVPVAIVLSERWRRNRMKGRTLWLAVLLAVAISCQIVAAASLGLIELP